MNDPNTTPDEPRSELRDPRSEIRDPRHCLAIVGIGCLFPKADGLGGYWANIKHAIDCIGDVPATHWNPSDYFDDDPKSPDMTYAKRGGFLSTIDFNPLEFGLPPKDIEATDTTQLLGLVAAKRALTDAGVVFADSGIPETHSPKPVSRNKVSVILGVTGTLELVIPLGARLGHPHWRRALKDSGVPDDIAQEVVERISDAYVPWQENSFPGLLGNVVAGRIANKLDLHGTNCVVDAACASSLSAVHLAAMELQTGKADVVVTGGADTFNDIFMFMCFSKTPALSKSGNSKPFDANGDGTILGEGLGMVVLKRLADAERDGDTIYAVIRSIGTSSDGKGNAIYAPSAEGQKRCLLDAYTRAGVSTDTVELIEAHGTGTKVGDATEASALADVFSRDSQRSARPWCAIGSVKSQIGHTKAAAGAASLIKAAMALHYKVLPPTLKVSFPVEPLSAEGSPFYVNAQMRPWLPSKHPRRAGVSAFGFGGSNFHAVLEEHTSEKTAVDWDGSVELFAISGTQEHIYRELAKVPTTSWAEFAHAAELSRQTFAVSEESRLILVAHRTNTDLTALVNSARNGLENQPLDQNWHTKDGVHYGSGSPSGKLAVLFPGQGSQYVGMLRELACLFPEMLDTLATANVNRLVSAIYPPTSFATDAKEIQEATIKSTDVAQPAIGAVSFGAWKVLHDRFGLNAHAFAGHSYGELPALAAAGRFSEKELFELSRLRGELMAQRRHGDAGAMLAVLAPLAEVEATLKESLSPVVIANKNSPKQTVLSGSTFEIDRIAKALGNKRLRVIPLPVAAAFHSELVADAAIPFREGLGRIPFYPARVPVFANSTGAEYPADAEAARNLLGSQLAKPVEFVEEIRAMVRAGVRTFLEVGPGSVLTKLVGQILDEPVAGFPASSEILAVAVDNSGGKRSGVLDFAEVLARLAARGYAVKLDAWEAGSRCRPPVKPTKPAMTIPLNGANYMMPRPKRAPRQPLDQNQFATSAAIVESHEGDTDLNTVQETLAALQRMQEETARLHKQFLESQLVAQQTIAALVAQQQAQLGGVAIPPLPAIPPSTMTMPTPLPPPIPTPPPAPVATVVPPTIPSPAPLPPVPTPAPIPIPAPKPKSSVVAVPPERNGNHAGPSSVVASTLLGVVSEKTGYPVDMLNLDMSLDTDLGIDSIKRVEILSALQEKLPGSNQIKPEHLGSLNTLRDVANLLAPAPTAAAYAPRPESRAATPVVPPVQTRVTPLPVPVPVSRTIPAQPAVEPEIPMAIPVDLPESAEDLSADLVGTTLLAVVSEKTGYPVEMLNLGMSLDTDLGIDSIKRVEILSALQEKLPGAAQVKPEHLGQLHTLNDVAKLLAPNSSAPPAPMKPATPSPGVSTKRVPVTPLEIPNEISQSTSKPLSSLSNKDSQALDVIAQSSKDPESGVLRSEMIAPKTERVANIIPTTLTDSALAPPLPPPLEALSPAISPLRPPTDRSATLETVERSIVQLIDLDLTAGRLPVSLPVNSEIWLIAEDEPLVRDVAAHLTRIGYVVRTQGWNSHTTAKPTGPLSGIVFVAPSAALPSMNINRLALQWLQVAGPRLRLTARTPHTALVVSVARLDGAFGFSNMLATTDPTSGGLAGIIKTVRWEWPEFACKAIDLQPSFSADNPAAAAMALVEEILAAGPIEVGISSNHRSTLELARTAKRNTTSSPIFNEKDVLLITGGAKGVTADVAVALAEAFRPMLVLTGRTPAPVGPEPAYIAGISDEGAIKQAIAKQLGVDATPRSIAEQYSRLMSQREIRTTLARITAAGARVVYHSVNVAAGRAVADLLHQVKVKYGSLTGIIHGAGVLADKRIEQLTPEQFDSVYSTKVDGIRNLLDLLSGEELKAIVLFSSITARVGRIGQLAYASANEVLNKIAQAEARKRPTSRIVAINWGPWDGGMVTPQLRKVFESEGVGVISVPDGAQFAVQELGTAGRAVEVIALAPKPRSSSTGSGSVVATNRVPPQPMNTPAPSPAGPAMQNELALAFERSVTVATHPMLRSHVLDGRAVLPMAIHMEWLAHAALHGNPGLVFHGFNDLRITHGVMVEESAPTTLRLMAARAVKNESTFVVPVELRGKRRDGREVVHSRAEVVLTSSLMKAPNADRAPDVQTYPHPIEDVYHYFLFHGPDMRGIESVEGLTDSAFIGMAYPAPAPSEWFTNPLRSSWVSDPLILDASFQMMILWSFAQHGAGSLPCFLGRFRQYRRSFPAGPTKVVIRVTRDNGSFARADIDFIDTDGIIVAQMQDYECVIDPGLNQAFRRNQLVTPAR